MNEEAFREFAEKNYVPVVRKQTSKLLLEKIKQINPKQILEIGTAIGFSGILMLENSTAVLTTLEKDPKMFEMAKQNFENAGLKSRVNLVLCDAFDFLKNTNQKFDFVFLDGPKGQYAKYLPYLLNLLSNGGLLFCDNVLFGGLVEDYSKIPEKKHRTIVNNLRTFLKMVQENENLDSELIRIEDGICLIKLK